MRNNLENNGEGEQPLGADVQAVATEFDKGTEMQNGSPLGKFKDTEKLLDAYNELQSEFTRKCQRLSDAEKKLEELSLNKDASKNQDLINEFAWNKNVGEFLKSHKNASEFVEEITNEIINDKDLQDREDALEMAYARVIEKKYIPHNELVSDQKFLEKYIYSNDEIKNKIIKEYVDSLQNNKNSITISNDGFSRGVSSVNNINSLEDARKYVEKMFRF